MKAAVIWDLDGTLFDSYPVIVESIYDTFREAGIQLTREQIKEHAIRYSSNALFYEMAEQYGIAAEALFARYRQISRGRYLDIKPMNNALETLQALQAQDVAQFVFTHRGTTTIPVLDVLQMTPFFQQILTSQSGFARKPDPEAILYLLQTHKLNPKTTFYVGDRNLDMVCAKNAGISAVLYRKLGAIDVADGTEDYIVTDLMQIPQMI